MNLIASYVKGVAPHSFYKHLNAPTKSFQSFTVQKLQVKAAPIFTLMDDRFQFYVDIDMNWDL